MKSSTNTGNWSQKNIYSMTIKVINEEKSLVCPTRLVPSELLERSDGWKAFRIEEALKAFAE